MSRVHDNRCSNISGRRRLALAVGLLAATLGGCAGTGGDAAQFLQLDLQATQENAGAVGQVALLPQGDETSLSFFIGGVPPWTGRPLNLLSYIYPGSCTALGSKPAYAMNSTTQTLVVDGGWRMAKSVPAELEDLREGSYSVVLRTTPADHSVNIFCAEIR
ncbi:hypothetical protein [Pseudomonas sp. N040]|uniref:hypothetical protein n=1 Tax=Pseudomonas sp. N040 TaxID=2785325 RepID=UPI0018A2BD15|nr:hypothetical protein [Pseudomonas sp. N040]MBF7730639.1 hypothetical protein [Pseudomonas sp. N040]MBW7014282.1 hypothetical protein [Pseudomonas sp. N040]